MRSWMAPPERIVRTVAVVAIAALILTVGWYGLVLLVQDGRADGPGTDVRVVERGGDYAAWVRTAGSERQHHAVSYSGEGPIDRIVLVRQSQLDALLAGGTVDVLLEVEPRTVGPRSFGTLDFQSVPSQCPPPTGGCTEESAPILVFLKGSGWRGTTSAAARTYAVQYQDDTAYGYDGPFGARVVTTSHSIHSTATWALPITYITAAIAAIATVGLAVLELRRRPTETPFLRVPSEMPTDAMLHLVRAGQLYIDGVRRSFLLAVWTIPAVTTVLLFVALPTMQAIVEEQLRFIPRLGAPTFIAFTFVVPFLALLAALFTGIAYWRTRRELRRWRELSAAFEDDARRILGA